jgi:serine/threonine protein kinase
VRGYSGYRPMGVSRIAGRYEVQEQLGEGGMGVVWRALDVKTGSAVAIKLMKDISDPIAVDLFTKEWRALAEISHPNIVEVRDVDVIEENRQKKPFFVMPLLRGATLAELIANASARLTLERIVEITTHVCRGLQAAHQRGLVHRDLKPSNIFVLDDDTAKIIDFGVVHLAGSKSVTGQKGTFQYMSPEQAQMKEITPASDLFSMGVILYEALTRRKPFARKTAEETVEAVIKFIPPPVSELYPSINQSVSKVVHKCLAKQPIHRFASARELSETLQRAARNEQVFDSAKIEPRIERARTAFKNGDEVFASEILGELEAEGHLDPRITVLRMQVDLTVKEKKVRQLLESARARMEQDEIPLALDKIREVLELDPQNPDALAMRDAMEKQRSEAQIARWLELAQTHLGNRDFASARNAAQEVLAIRRADARALDLLEKIESTEADAKRIREQKEQFYSSALRAYQNGEIDTALSKLERLFSVARANPNAAIPERDAVYQSFYKEVRSERDHIHSALEEAQRQFSEKNFAIAMVVCRQLLRKYPNDGTFQALKIRIEDAERQELSSYIAGVSKRLEEEPDLDKRVNILREASERYPNETQFAQQLKLVRERRDLVNAIVAKARQYEERGQYAEAISQWDTLRNIHPHYSGIAFEMEQCRKKRDRQAREEEHLRLVQGIDGLMENRAFSKALECADAAIREFPGDAELSGLRTLAEQGIERTRESRRLFEEGQRALAEKDLIRATELLRRCLNLDPRGPGLRDAVVNVLTERARALAEANWREAEPLCQEASQLDATHPAVRALRASITEGKRQAFVGQCLMECRALAAAGRPQEAAERIRAARAEYPNDPRLEQYEATLQREVNELQYREERARDRAVLDENRKLAEQDHGQANLQAVLDKSYSIRARYPDDAEIGQTVADIELTIQRTANVEELSQLLTLKNATLIGIEGPPAVVSKPGSAPISPLQVGRAPKLVDKSTASATAEPHRPSLNESTSQLFFHQAIEFAKDVERRALAFLRPEGKWSSTSLLALGSVFILAAAVAYVILRPKPAKPSLAATTSARVQITTDPSDSEVTSNGQPLPDGTAAVGTTIEVSRLGYKARQVQIQKESDGKVVLEPEPLHLSIHTSEATGSVALDELKVGDLTDGSLDDDLPADGKTHILSVAVQGRPLFTVELQIQTGGQPRVSKLDANDLFAITSLGNRATVYGGKEFKNVRLGDQSVSVSPSGAELTLSDQYHELSFPNGNGQGSIEVPISDAPSLVVQSLNAPAQVVVTTSVDNIEKATLTVDGSPVPRGKHGWTVTKPPGSHTFSLAAEGYETKSWTVTMQRGKVLSKNLDLAAKVIAPAMVALVITGGTPGAVVELDGNRAGGELDRNGNLTLQNVLTEGRHRVTFSKAGLETESAEIVVKPPSEGRINNVRLSASTRSLSFETDVKNVKVKYRRVGDIQFTETTAPGKAAVAPGTYEIIAQAPGYQEFSTQIPLDRGNATVPLKLVPGPGYELEDPDQITREGEWFKSRSSGKFVPLKTGNLNVNLIFAPPGKTLLWEKKVEWFVEIPQPAVQVRYALEGHKLTRKLVMNDMTSEAKETKVDSQSISQQKITSVHIRVKGAKINIINDKGVVLDDFSVPGQDFSKGRITIRTDSHFLVRSENQ